MVIIEECPGVDTGEGFFTGSKTYSPPDLQPGPHTFTVRAFVTEECDEGDRVPYIWEPCNF